MASLMYHHVDGGATVEFRTVVDPADVVAALPVIDGRRIARRDGVDIAGGERGDRRPVVPASARADGRFPAIPALDGGPIGRDGGGIAFRTPDSGPVGAGDRFPAVGAVVGAYAVDALGIRPAPAEEERGYE